MEVDNAEQFKNYLLALNEKSFYKLCKNYLSPHLLSLSRLKLAEQLELFLGEPKVQAQMLFLLTTKDLELLSIVGYLKSAKVETIKGFYYKESTLKIEQLISNLCERFWLIQEGGRKKYKINPLLTTLLAPYPELETPLNFVTMQKLEKTEPFWFTTPFFMAYSNLFIFKKSASFRQDFLTMHSKNHLLNANLDRAFKALNLIDEFNTINVKQFELLAKLSGRERLAYFVAAAIDAENIEKLALFILSLWQGVYHGFDKKGFFRYYAMTCQEVLDESYFELLSFWKLIEVKDNFVEVMVASEELSGSKITIQSDFTAQVMPNTVFSVPFILAFELNHFDMVSVYQISKKSFFHFLQQGYYAEHLLENFEQTVQQPVATIILESIKHWSIEYTQVVLERGFLLRLSADKLALIAEEPAFLPYLTHKITEGVYFFNAKPDQKFLVFLQKIGASNNFLGEKAIPLVGTAEIELKKIAVNPLAPTLELASSKTGGESSSFLNALLELTTNSEWQRRIRRRVVLFPEQLAYEKVVTEEITGLNFQGKKRFIQQAIENDIYIEVDVTKDFDIVHFYLKPVAIKKINEEFYLQAINAETFKKLTLLIKGLASVRLISHSLY